MHVLCFGDSITQGFWDIEGGWVSRVRKQYDKEALNEGTNKYVSFFNLGIDGDTTEGILERFANETEVRTSTDVGNVIIFATGTNDTIFRDSEDFSTPEQYLQQLEQLLSDAKKYSNHIIFVGLTPVDDSILNPMPWSQSGKCYSTERMKLFNEKLEEFCAKHNVRYVNVWSSFAERDISDVMYDGVHPNATGHAIIADEVHKELQGIIG